MKNVKTISILFVSLILFLFAKAQNETASFASCNTKEASPFSNCTAAFLNNKMMVDDYSPKGNCMTAKAQNETASPASCLTKEANPFSNCTAAFLNNKMMVDDYSPRGKCVMAKDAKGKLMVSTVNLSLAGIEPFIYVGFKVAIRNDETSTLWLFSDETYYEIDVEKILAKCQKGDKIVLITVDSEYSLPHNEIAISEGC